MMPNIKRMLIVLLSASALLQGATSYKVIARYPVPNDGGFDYVTLDGATRRLYLSHATQVEVVDADSGKLIGTIPDTPGVHGVAIEARRFLRYSLTGKLTPDNIRFAQ